VHRQVNEETVSRVSVDTCECYSALSEAADYLEERCF